jgi:outer membrane protein OmpA-like peptidoglycan-associated protein
MRQTHIAPRHARLARRGPTTAISLATGCAALALANAPVRADEPAAPAEAPAAAETVAPAAAEAAPAAAEAAPATPPSTPAPAAQIKPWRPIQSARAETGLAWLVTDPMAQQFGLGGGLSLTYEYRWLKWLGFEGRVSAYFFPSDEDFPTTAGYGSYFAPSAGVRVHPLADDLNGDLWVGASLALISTGEVIRPGAEVGAGFEYDLTDWLHGGPYARFHYAFETNRDNPGWADGDFLSIGFSGSMRVFEPPPPPPPPDADKDGLIDSADACPDKAEDFNKFKDQDGCPDGDLDSDGDGIFDVSDACVDAPEDKDGFQDQDGCPDPDNDGDGILDLDDKCPEQPGPDAGCPVPDRDGDGVFDAVDTCPDVAGKAEFNGCAEAQKVVVTEAGLEILEEVFFRLNGSEILEKSFGLLDNVAAILNTHTQLTKIRVEGHTDSRGSAAYNRKLSQARAESVVKYLVEKGKVDAGRLVPVGFGPDQPRVPDAKTEADHAKNRRVQFKIDKDEAGGAVKTKTE